MSSHTNGLGLLTVPECAKLLQIAERRVWTLIKSRALPALRIGRSVRIRPADLERYRQHQAMLTRLGFVPSRLGDAQAYHEGEPDEVEE